ncbi:MAG: hypothetical protein ACPG5U_07955 [Planktomarina sp.]
MNANYGNATLAAEAAVGVARVQGQIPRLCRTGIEDITLHKTKGNWSVNTGKPPTIMSGAFAIGVGWAKGPPQVF